jgi:hypothetical protein
MDPPLPGALGKELRTVRALLNTVKALLLISLCLSTLLKLYFSFKYAEIMGPGEM